MRIISLLCIAIFSLSGCAGGFKVKPRDDWSKWNTSLCLVATATAMMDAHSTNEALSYDGVSETNPIIGDDPSTSTVWVFKGAVAAGTYLMANNVEPKWRNVVCGWMAFLQGGAAIHNYRLADKMENK